MSDSISYPIPANHILDNWKILKVGDFIITDIFNGPNGPVVEILENDVVFIDHRTNVKHALAGRCYVNTGNGEDCEHPWAKPEKV